MGEEPEDEKQVRNKINEDTDQYKRKDDNRIEELAKPKRCLLMATYIDYSKILPKEKVERLKQLLKEIYAMTPEDTEKYFAQMRKAAEKVMMRKRMRAALKRALRRDQKKQQTAKAYNRARKVMKEGLIYATENEIPPIISVRLRNLANIILEQICDLRDVGIPDRNSSKKQDIFLMQISDWIAVAIEQIYFVAKSRNKEDLNKIDTTYIENMLNKSSDGTIGEPLATSSPKESTLVEVINYGEEEGM